MRDIVAEPVLIQFALQHRIPLRHAGDVSLLAAREDEVWVEETYGDLWVAQHEVHVEVGLVASVDEDEGRAGDLKPLDIPAGAFAPRRAWAALRLNMVGARDHGLRDEDRLNDVLRPLSVEDKFAVAAWLGVPAPSLLGLAERYVLAECALAAPDDLLLCLRLRFAVAVPRHTGADGLACDYVSRVGYVLQRWHVGDDAPPLEGWLNGLPGAALKRPMDIQRIDDRLLVAEGSEGERAAALCVLQLEGLPPKADPAAELLRKLYG